jgi:hypothetical protein
MALRTQQPTAVHRIDFVSSRLLPMTPRSPLWLSRPTRMRPSSVKIFSCFDGINGRGYHDSLIPKESVLYLQHLIQSPPT